MLYTSYFLDRKTGELVSVDAGDWITITELGELYDVGSRRVRAILRHMGFLQIEGGGRQHRHRLCRWVTDQGWGKRIQHKGTVPFDVIGPDARQWIAERWSHTVSLIEENSTAPIREAKVALSSFREDRNRYRRSHDLPEMDVPEIVSWLRHFHSHLSHADIASILDISQQLVSRYLSERQRERNRLEALKHAPLQVKKWHASGVQMDML
ncbi:hypothetical protein MRBLRH13_001461 [Agrobacterium radiobacter]|uniref:hypothetical protein n=1 Tax=Agrobacterium radiobacter TaxID=362 RepID=UPI003429411A